MKKSAFYMLLFCTTSFAMGLSINKPVVIGKGERSGGCSSVNGSITVKEDAKVTGTCRTVNGSIRIDQNCRVEKLQSVNGAVSIGKDTHIDGSIETVNGHVICNERVLVKGDINTVNGSIELYETTIRNDITTHNGSVRLENNSMVLEDIIIKDSHNTGNSPRIEIRIVNSTVEGDVINRDEEKQVTVRMVGKSRVNGELINIDRVERDQN